MSATLSPVAVFGATGAQGSSVVKALAAAGVSVIGLTRDPTSAAATALGVPVRAADLGNPSTLAPALAGVKAIYLVTDYCECGSFVFGKPLRSSPHILCPRNARCPHLPSPPRAYISYSSMLICCVPAFVKPLSRCRTPAGPVGLGTCSGHKYLVSTRWCVQ